jgi:hypothetical protein
MEMKIRLYLLKLLFKIINIYESKYSFYTASMALPEKSCQIIPVTSPGF